VGQSCSTACASFYADRPGTGVGRGCRSYNGGDLAMRAIWINAVANAVANVVANAVACLPDAPDGFGRTAPTHRY
ncbi:hypothetical protein QMO17_34665, partial [Klebsiella pneumoniae]|nr:hypothetical protein [Klebsiella pneumoniae]